VASQIKNEGKMDAFLYKKDRRAAIGRKRPVATAVVDVLVGEMMKRGSCAAIG
jgi:hypothetical protein